MNGHIHSIESFGTVDGPGVRMVVFFQGCPMRCLYCHNPDTWSPQGGTELSVEQILSRYESSRAFYSHGGITATGGEPLLQIDFVIELFEAASRRGIHTCLDTSGIIFRPESPEMMKKFDKLLSFTDLILLDIKHIDPKHHQKLCSQPNAPILAFARYLSDHNVPVWIRHVVVPGITDNPDSLYQLGEFIGSLKNVKALDVLPYHDMGKGKYHELGIIYPLENVKPLTKEDALTAKKIILRGIRDVRSRH